MTDPNASLLQEIQEDLNRQRLQAFWTRYGIGLGAVALALVVATAGVSVWHGQKLKNEQRLTTDLLTTAKSESASAASLDALAAFASKPENIASTQAAIALLQAGAMAVEQNDVPKAVRLFDQVAQNPKTDSAFRQLGDLLSVQAQLDWGDAAALSLRLQPLTLEGRPWRFSALEAQGYLALRMGDAERAKQIFRDLSQDARVPSTMGARATDILHGLKGAGG